MARGSQLPKATKLAAAFLSCNGAEPQEIAKILHIGIASVYRAIKEATEDKVIAPQPSIFMRDQIAPDLMAEVEALAEGGDVKDQLDELGKKLDLPVPAVHVVNSGLEATIPDGEAGMRALERFGAEAAKYVREVVERGTVCGVSWGQTMSAVVSGIERSLRTYRRAEDRFINFVPIVGEFPGTRPTQTSASSLALRLMRVFNGDSAAEQSYSLAGLPSLIPIDFDENDMAVVDKLAHNTYAYRAIFGKGPSRSHAADEAPPLINRLDCVLTSVGPSGQPFGSHADRFLGLANLTAEKLKGGCDIAGVLLRAPNINGKPIVDGDGKPIMDKVKEHWRGLTMDDLRRCAEKARETKTGAAKDRENKMSGVVVVAVGANKAETLWHCIRERLVNHFVIDRGLLLAFGTHLKRMKP